MLAFCEAHAVDYQICGKVIVATKQGDLERLDALTSRAEANGVEARPISQAELAELEPHAAGIAALHVPGAGITDYTEVCRTLARVLDARGNTVMTNTEVTRVGETAGAVQLTTTAGDVEAQLAITCGGLQSDRLAIQTAPDTTERIMPFRGEYFELAESRRHLVNGLIYPVPNPDFPFLGVHLTPMIDGSIHAGPNAVLALAREGYTWGDVNLGDITEVLLNPGWWKLARTYWKTGLGEYYRSFSKRAFVKALQELVPEIGIDDLVRSPAGVRAQAVGRDGNLLDDFVWSETDRVINVLNAPSPAATASLAIGTQIVDRALRHRFPNAPGS
jgi:L-2-hydroxyglutarate oxidase